MFQARTGALVKVTAGRSVLYGRFDHPELTCENRSILHPEQDFWEGTVDLVLETGQVVGFRWDEKRGVIADAVEEVEG